MANIVLGVELFLHLVQPGHGLVVAFLLEPPGRRQGCLFARAPGDLQTYVLKTLNEFTTLAAPHARLAAGAGLQRVAVLLGRLPAGSSIQVLQLLPGMVAGYVS